MAGLGRRTHYRKHVTDSVLNDFPEPGETESIAVVVSTRGSNQFDVRLPNRTNSQLAILPTKFRKLVWLKRNDYVIVQTGVDNSIYSEGDKDPDSEKSPKDVECHFKETSTPSASTEETGSIRCIVMHILYSEQIKHLRSRGLWPTDDPGFEKASGVDPEPQLSNNGDQSTTTRGSATMSDGIVYESYTMDSSEVEDDKDLFINTNRVSRITIHDDSSSDDSED